MLKDKLLKLTSMFTKREVDNQFDANLDLLDKFVLPSAREADKMTKIVQGYHSKEAADIDALIQKSVKVAGAKYMTTTLVKVLEETKVKMILCQDILSKDDTTDILRESISVKDFNVVRMVEVTRFTIDYTRRLLGAVFAAESVARGVARGENRTGDVSGIVTDFGWVTDAEIEWLNAATPVYIQLAKYILMPAKEFVSIFDDMADVQLSPTTADSIATINGVKRVDPFNLASVKGVDNLFGALIFGEASATQIVKRYEEAQADSVLIQSIILKIQRDKEGKPSPKLDQQIEYYSARLDKIRAEIQRTEDRYNINRR